MNENLPFVWQKSYQNRKAAEIAHEKTGQYCKPRRRGCDKIDKIGRVGAWEPINVPDGISDTGRM